METRSAEAGPEWGGNKADQWAEGDWFLGLYAMAMPSGRQEEFPGDSVARE